MRFLGFGSDTQRQAYNISPQMRAMACCGLEMGLQIRTYHNESDPQTPRTTDNGADHHGPNSTIPRKGRPYAGRVDLLERSNEGKRDVHKVVVLRTSMH
jgi:hypothetical protein